MSSLITPSQTHTKFNENKLNVKNNKSRVLHHISNKKGELSGYSAKKFIISLNGKLGYASLKLVCSPGS